MYAFMLQRVDVHEREQIAQGFQRMDLGVVLGQAPQTGFLMAELPIDHA
jgi:hypothetical protein